MFKFIPFFSILSHVYLQGVKPVNVEVLAKLVVSGALGQLSGNIDGNDNIAAMASS